MAYSAGLESLSADDTREVGAPLKPFPLGLLQVFMRKTLDTPRVVTRLTSLQGSQPHLGTAEQNHKYTIMFS